MTAEQRDQFGRCSRLETTRHNGTGLSEASDTSHAGPSAEGGRQEQVASERRLGTQSGSTAAHAGPYVGRFSVPNCAWQGR